MVARAGNASSINKRVSPKLFISIAILPKAVAKTQSEVAQYESILIPFRERALLAGGSGKGQVSLWHFHL